MIFKADIKADIYQALQSAHVASTPSTQLVTQSFYPQERLLDRSSSHFCSLAFSQLRFCDFDKVSISLKGYKYTTRKCT